MSWHLTVLNDSRPRWHSRLVSLCASLAVLAAVAPTATAASQPPGQLRAGAAKVDITPALDTKAVAPQGGILPVTSIRDHLHVRAIYFENNVTCGALVGVEQGAMFGAEPAVQQAARAVGCPRENLVVSAVHTHSGGTKNLAGDTPPDNKPDQATIGAAIVKAKYFDDELVHAYGVLMGEASIEALKNAEVNWQATPAIGGSVGKVTCPGRDRLDMSARQGVLPSYRDGDPVDIQVGVLKIGDIDMVSVDGEVYNQIATHLKRVSPVTKTMMVTLASGPQARSGYMEYIYSNAASDHLTFEVIGSRLKPGCAEDAIVSSSVSQIQTLDRAHEEQR